MRKLDIQGLDITVTSGGAKTGAAKGKSKAKSSDGLEILTNAKLQLKAGQRYALVGKNGSGKSSEAAYLPCMAEKRSGLNKQLLRRGN